MYGNSRIDWKDCRLKITMKNDASKRLRIFFFTLCIILIKIRGMYGYDDILGRPRDIVWSIG